MSRFIGPNSTGKLSPQRNPLSVDASGGIQYLGGGNNVTANNTVRGKINKLLKDGNLSEASKTIKNNFNIDTSSKESIRKGIPTSESDVKEFVFDHLKGIGRKQTIVNPNQDFEAIHRVSPYKKSSVFFDRSPRKTRK